MPTEDELLDVKDVANRLRINPRTVLRMAERGDLPAIKVARRWRFRRGALDEYLREEPQTLSSQQPAPNDWHAAEQGLRTGSKKQATELDTVQQEFNIVQQRLALVGTALETADKLVTKLHPHIDEDGRAKLLQKLLPSLLESGNGKSLELVLSASTPGD